MLPARKLACNKYYQKHKEILKDKAKAWQRQNPDKVKTIKHRARRKAYFHDASFYRKSNLRKYGLTLEDFELLEKAQNGVCAICHKPEVHSRWKRLFVDHNHKTGQVRGLLCSLCNFGIGSLQEEPALLLRAKEYLEKWAK